MPDNGRPLAVLWKPATTRQNLSANLKAVRELIGVGAHSNQPTHGKDVLTVTLTELVVLAGASRTLFLGQVDDVSFAADDGEERWKPVRMMVGAYSASMPMARCHPPAMPPGRGTEMHETQ